MTIVPSGKTRMMMAQVMGDSMPQNFAPEENKPAMDPFPRTLPLPEENNGIDSSQNDKSLIEEPPMEEPVAEDTSNDGKMTLTTFVFKKLVEFGYPPRRLEEFKAKFVNQDISADGIETVKIEMPDKKYPDPTTGKADTIETSDLTGIAKEVGRSFGLNFTGAHRADGKWTIDFSSAKVEQEPEDGAIGDSLDDVYGNPGKNFTKNRDKAAKVETEMKLNKDAVINELIKIIGEKK